MKATLLLRRRERLRPDTFAEVVVWRLARRIPASEHGYKYRPALIDRLECVLRYDNEAGKGDHRHSGDAEEPYRFTTIEPLLEDFDADIRSYLDEHPDPR